MYIYKEGVCFFGIGICIGVQIILFHQNDLCLSANRPFSSVSVLQFAKATLLSSIHFCREVLRISASRACLYAEVDLVKGDNFNNDNRRLNAYDFEI